MIFAQNWVIANQRLFKVFLRIKGAHGHLFMNKKSFINSCLFCLFL